MHCSIKVGKEKTEFFLNSI